MIEGQNPGDSAQPLTVDSAAPLLDRLFSGESEETQSETQNTDETPEAPSPEDEGDEESAESEDKSTGDEKEAEASDEDDEADPEDNEEQPALHAVKVNGEEAQVTLDELKKGYSREKDYTQKSQKLAEDRRQYETTVKTERDALTADRQRYLSQNRELEEALGSLVKEPDWDKLRIEAPDQFADIHAAWTAHKKSMDALVASRKSAEDEALKAFEKSESERVAGEQTKLFEAIPAWSDKAVRDKEASEILAYGKKLGFGEKEIRGVTDHRALVTLRKAMLYDRAQEAADKAKQTAAKKIEKVKAAAPGSTGKKPVSEVTKAKQRHAKVGTTESAAQVLSHMFDD